MRLPVLRSLLSSAGRQQQKHALALDAAIRHFLRPWSCASPLIGHAAKAHPAPAGTLDFGDYLRLDMPGHAHP
jgi:hypothetical protein